MRLLAIEEWWDSTESRSGQWRKVDLGLIQTLLLPCLVPGSLLTVLSLGPFLVALGGYLTPNTPRFVGGLNEIMDINHLLALAQCLVHSRYLENSLSSDGGYS